jgi:hypothetical protein
LLSEGVGRGVVENLWSGELREGAADELIERELKELTRRAVRIDVPTVAIREHHRLERAVEHRSQQLLAVAQPVLSALHRVLHEG